MARLIPEFLEPKIKTVLEATPTPLRYAVCVTYWRLIRTHYSLQVWYRYGRHYEAPLEPFRLISVDPSNINYYSNHGGNKLYPLIKGGEWDKQRSCFKNGSVYRSFHDRFIIGKSWSETERYHDYIEKYGSKEAVLKQSDKLGEAFDMFEDVNTVEDAFRKYDHIFEKIQEDGYQFQRDINSIEQRLENPGLFSSAVPEADEITVDVGRDGTIMCFSGQHRLAMAKILNLDLVPVRVRLRHKQWQKKRDAVWRDKAPPEEHPDF